MKIIGIVGKKRSGKDTIGDHLIHNHHFTRYGFADPLKKGAMEMFGYSYESCYGTAEQKEEPHPVWGMSAREMLQILGTELLQYDIHKHTKNFEHIGRNVWAKRFELWVDQQKTRSDKQTHGVVITDVRYIHEAKLIRAKGGVVWKVVRPGIDGNQDLHSSEMEMDEIVPDETVHNDGTLSDLYVRVNNLMEK